MSGIFSADGDTETSGDGLGAWTVRLEVGAGLNNLAKVVTKDSRIPTWTFSISFARRIDLRPTAHSMPRSAEREPGSTLTQTINGSPTIPMR
jgi:hypothetical protein